MNTKRSYSVKSISSFSVSYFPMFALSATIYGIEVNSGPFFIVADYSHLTLLYKFFYKNFLGWLNFAKSFNDYLEPSRTSTMKFFLKNSSRLLLANSYF